jgi:protein SCO1/2
MSETDHAPHRTPLVVFGIWLIAVFIWWGLAFLPIPAANPEWVEAARKVCFGTLENGLPDTWGWMVLIFGPLSFLIAILVAWGGPLRAGLAALRSSSGGRALLIAVLFTAFWLASWVAFGIREARRITTLDFASELDGPLPAHYPRTDRPAPPFALINQNGDTITLDSFKGRPLVMTFAFAHCRTICPAIVQQCRDAMTQIGEGASMVIITLDPWRDTPSTLARMTETMKLPPNAHILSGTVEAVNKTLDDYAVARQRDEKTGDVVHPAMTYVMDDEGRIAYTFSNAPPPWLAEAVRRIRSGNGS